MTVQLKDAINYAETFIKLNAIAKQLDPYLSYWGRRYMTVRSNQSPYSGEVPIGILVVRALKIIELSGYDRNNYPDEWIDAAHVFDSQIERIYHMDKRNMRNCAIITSIARIIRSICTRIWYWSSSTEELSHQYKWAGLGHNSYFIGLDRHILEPRPGTRRTVEGKIIV